MAEGTVNGGLGKWVSIAKELGILVRDIGFPIVVAAYLLIQLNASISAMTAALIELKDAVKEQRAVLEKVVK